MKCIKCSADIPDGSVYCYLCGKKQIVAEKKRSVKLRGNGQGTAYKRGNTWTACVTLGWIMPEDLSKPKIPVRKTKGGFKTKKDAIDYCPTLRTKGNEGKRMTMQEVWNAWSDMYAPRIVKSTMDCYK